MCRRTCCPFFWGGIGIIGSGNCCCNAVRNSNSNNNSNSNSGCSCCNCCGN